jgi:hypothetical protein
MNKLCALSLSLSRPFEYVQVPLGVNVESVSIVKEEIDAAHDLFQSLQKTLLDSRVHSWAVRWSVIQPLPLTKPNDLA